MTKTKPYYKVIRRHIHLIILKMGLAHDHIVPTVSIFVIYGLHLDIEGVFCYLTLIFHRDDISLIIAYCLPVFIGSLPYIICHPGIFVFVRTALSRIQSLCKQIREAMGMVISLPLI